MMPQFNFWLTGQCRYIGLTKTLRAEITRDASGKRHLEIMHRNKDASRNCVKPSEVIVYSTSAASVQSCKKRANEFLREVFLTMRHFAATIAQAARVPVERAQEHHPQRAKVLRAEMRSKGKAFHELTAAELIEINKLVDEKCHAEND